MWVIRGRAAGLGGWEKVIGGESLEGEDLWDLKEMGIGGREGCHMHVSAEQIIRQAD